MRANMVVCVVIVLIGTISGCGKKNQSTDVKQAHDTQKMLAEANRQMGMPNIVNFQQRKTLKWILELTDKENLITYTYIKSDMTGKLVFIGKSLGYGIPFSAQYTNPSRIWDLETDGGAKNKIHDNGEIQVLPQPDPNGLFMPTSSSATWVILIDPDNGKPRVVYVEPEIVVSPFPLGKQLGGVVIGDESKWGHGKDKHTASKLPRK